MAQYMLNFGGSFTLYCLDVRDGRKGKVVSSLYSVYSIPNTLYRLTSRKDPSPMGPTANLALAIA